MIKVGWDVEELVALVDIYRHSGGKTSKLIDMELIELSDALIRRAKKLDIPHDEKFRNLNGMKMMFQNVAYIATDGQQGMSSTSTSMKTVYEMLSNAPDAFELILKEFNKRYR